MKKSSCEHDEGYFRALRLWPDEEEIVLTMIRQGNCVVCQKYSEEYSYRFRQRLLVRLLLEVLPRLASDAAAKEAERELQDMRNGTKLSKPGLLPESIIHRFKREPATAQEPVHTP